MGNASVIPDSWRRLKQIIYDRKVTGDASKEIVLTQEFYETCACEMPWELFVGGNHPQCPLDGPSFLFHGYTVKPERQTVAGQ